MERGCRSGKKMLRLMHTFPRGMYVWQALEKVWVAKTMKPLATATVGVPRLYYSLALMPRGKDPKRPPHSCACCAMARLAQRRHRITRKDTDATRARADKRRAKRKARARSLKQQAAARVEEAKRMADEMQQRERDAKRQEIERQKNRKKTMAAEAAASDKAQRRDMTQEEIQEINKVVRLRRETESQHRSTVFELERLQKESRAAQISQTIDSWLSDTSAADARKEGEEGTQGVGTDCCSEPPGNVLPVKTKSSCLTCRMVLKK